MRRIRFVMVIGLILVFLNTSGCGMQKNLVQGEVLEVSGNQLLLKTREKTLLIVREEDTLIGSWLEGFQGQQILDGSLNKPTVVVLGRERIGKERFGGVAYPVYQAEQIFLEAVREEDAYTLADGSRLDLRRSDDWKTYLTKEGIPLLREDRATGPQNVAVGSLLGYEQLGKEAQANITAWYDCRGLLYDLDAELEWAWQVYRSIEEKSMFQTHHVWQHISPSAYNEELIWFCTSVNTTVDQNTGTELRTCQAFRRENGEPVDTVSLFRCPEKQILEKFLDEALPSGNDREPLRKAFRMEYLNFERDRLEIWFPAGSLPTEKHTWILSVEYRNLGDLLWDWAVPEARMAE